MKPALAPFTWKLTRSLTGLSIAMCALTMTGCGYSMIKSDALTMPPNLAARCPDLALLADGTGGVVLKWAVGTVKPYQDCQDRQARLVEAWPK